MTSYVANYRKRILILEGREAKLRILLSKGAPEEKLLKMAEVVRDARVRAERAKRESISPEDWPDLRKRIAEIDAKIVAIRVATPEDVLAEFRRSR